MQAFNHLSQKFEKYLEQQPFSQEPIELYAPIDYILGLGGKRLRPLMVLLGCGLFREDANAALPAAMAMEVFHNFTLVHDDIMDEAPLRRGRPTVHARYDVNTAILSGDTMLIKAYQFLLEVQPTSLLPDLIGLFNRTAIQVCEGQQYDMNFETRAEVQIPEYLKMIELKTAVLFACALKMGALIGGAKLTDADQLYEFARLSGIAFQLQDDVLDTFGDPEKFGKKVGGDIIQNKKTFLVLTALEKGTPQQTAQLLKWMASYPADEATKIRAVKAIFEELHIREATEALMETYRKNAFAALDAVQAPSEKKEQLKQLTDFLLGRDV